MGLKKTFQRIVYKLRSYKKGKMLKNEQKLNQPAIRKIFIDAGAHAGESVSFYLDRQPKLKGSIVYFFEPNPQYAQRLKEMENNRDYKVIYKPEAVWTKNEELSFFIAKDQWGDAGSTLLPEKKEVLDRERPLKVRAIDFAEFLKTNVTANDYVIVKLDIEGAEYKVIEHLIETNTICMINEIWVEWHDRFYPDIDHFGVRYKLSAQDVAVYDWEL
jgi:FkbM family methyltransferase